MEKADIQHEDTWGASVSPKFASNLHTLSLTPRPSRTSDSPVPIIQRPQSSPPRSSTESDGLPASPPDLMPHLQRSAPSIVKTRTGSVLSRGFILKTDFYPSGESKTLHAPSSTDTHYRELSFTCHLVLNTGRAYRYTFAYSSVPTAVLLDVSVELVYISGRPFVLRDSAEPRKTLPLSDRPENLEAIEQRLKNDILAEGVRCEWFSNSTSIRIECVSLMCRFGSLILTHNEIGE